MSCAVMAWSRAFGADTAAALHHSLWLNGRLGLTAPGHCMTCSLTHMLSEDTWWPVEEIAALHFIHFIFSSKLERRPQQMHLN